jgi:hypothetical protein
MTAATLAAALALAAVHLLPRHLDRFASGVHTQVVSFSGGVSVAFVLIYLLPELVAHQDTVGELVGGVVPFYDHDVFLLALVGLVLFYGLEKAARIRRRAVFLEEVAIGVFALYYAVIGKLLWDQAATPDASLPLFTAAMALHFLVVDQGLREHHREAYAAVGRWVLSGAVLAGWFVGWLAALPDGVIGVMLGVVAGGVVLIALTQELPSEREGSFGSFLAGTVVAAVVFMLI